MKYKIIFLLLFSSCVSSTHTNKNNFTYSAKGFAHIDDQYIKKKFDSNKFFASHNKLKLGTKIQISNPVNKIAIEAIIKKKIKYDDFYKVSISKKIAKKLGLDLNFPYIEISEIKKNKSFIAKKAITENVEMQIANKAPVEKININNLTPKKISLTKVKTYSILVAEFYNLKSAEFLKKKLVTILEKSNYHLTHVNKVNNNESVAIRHFFKANTTPFTHLPAAEEATNILCKNGYVKEAAYFIKQIITKLDDENTLVQSDLDSIYSCFESYKNQKIISIHQPAYIAWLGYFHKIYYADKFVIHDAVQFSKKSFIKRTLIKKTNANESRYLTIPAQKHSDYCYINEMKANETNDWRNKHIREIESTYRTAPYFKSVFPLITSIFESTRNTSSIVDITSKFTLGILEILEIKREIYCSS